MPPSDRQPGVLSFALHAYGWAVHDADPVRSLVTLRRGLAIAQDSGNRADHSNLAANLSPLRGRTRRPAGSLQLLHRGDRQLSRLGQHLHAPHPPGNSAAFFDLLGRYEPAATIAGFAVTSPVAALPAMAAFGTAITHLRDVLGDQTYESLARRGETMTTAEIVTYAYDQIDQARTELEQPTDSMGNAKDRGEPRNRRHNRARALKCQRQQ